MTLVLLVGCTKQHTTLGEPGGFSQEWDKGHSTHPYIEHNDGVLWWYEGHTDLQDAADVNYDIPCNKSVEVRGTYGVVRVNAQGCVVHAPAGFTRHGCGPEQFGCIAGERWIDDKAERNRQVERERSDKEKLKEQQGRCREDQTLPECN